MTFDPPLRAVPILFLLTGLCSGCSPFEQSAQRMTDEQFVAFFVAMSKATKQYVEEPARLREAHQALYREYGISPEVVQATIAHYQEQPERWTAILEQIGEELSKAENEGRGDKESKK